MPTRCIHGDAGDNTDDPGAMTQDGGFAIREWVKAPLNNLKNVHIKKTRDDPCREEVRMFVETLLII